jgi:vacuolar-type H+-ATPase subunit B/Vma2
MLSVVDSKNTKEPNKCFKITYFSEEVELIMASSMGVTEDLREFITFYDEDEFREDLVCILNKSLIKKIETVIAPKLTKITNGKKEYEAA